MSKMSEALEKYLTKTTVRVFAHQKSNLVDPHPPGTPAFKLVPSGHLFTWFCSNDPSFFWNPRPHPPGTPDLGPVHLAAGCITKYPYIAKPKHNAAYGLLVCH